MTGTKQKNIREPRPFIIHGHFYQPPRENPWLGIIERQPSAAPARDWNERVYDECYRPNAYSRLLDPQGKIRGIYNNYGNMSFNFGPTLFQWMIDAHEPVVERIIEADKKSCARLNGHGNAIAQVYNHIIMPLASRRDQLTQIRWAKSFFSRNFGRDPEGIWLAETAINLDTVNCLIDEGIHFTVLAPTQAEAFRSLNTGNKWTSTENSPVDTRRAYRIYADKGHSRFLDVFFFDEGLSKAASFGDLLTNGDHCAASIAGCFDSDASEPQVSILATDGETFGHHKPYGDMCLAFLFTESAVRHNIAPINFGYWLEIAPPVYEVSLKNAKSEGTAWSCAHGVGRWYRDCGCQTGGRDEWSQEWRTPLRESLNELQKKVDHIFKEELAAENIDPWLLRDIYEPDQIRRKPELLRDLVAQAGARSQLSSDTLLRIRQLLEAQKFMLFSFTSCGWFFAELSGIEPMQNLGYACRAMQLCHPERTENPLLAPFLSLLSAARSNIDNVDGAELFKRYIAPSMPYMQILAFTSCLEHVLKTSDCDNLRYGLCSTSIEHADQLSPEQDENQAFHVSVQNEMTAENTTYRVLVIHGDSHELTGYVLPGGPGAGQEPPQGVGAGIDLNPEAVRLEMQQLFEGARNRMSALLVRRASGSILDTMTSWMDENEALLDSVAALCRTLPQPYESHISLALLAQWNANMDKVMQFDSEGEAFQTLCEIWDRARHFGVSFDLSESAVTLENMLLSELPLLASELKPESCDRVTFLLNVVDRFGIPVRKHLIEDLYYPILTTKVADLQSEVASQENPTPQKQALLIRLLTFSSRLNFSVEESAINPTAQKSSSRK